MTFDPTKPVQTRDGRPARILCTDARNNYRKPIFALVTHGDSEQFWQYHSDGKINAGSITDVLDLVNIPERIQLKRWVHIYKDRQGAYTTCTFMTKADAPRGSHSLVACVEIDLDCRVGEGL